MTVSTPRVLVVSESRITRRVVEMTFADQPLELVMAPSGAAGLQAWQDRPAAVVVVDLAMEPPDGLALARRLATLGPPVPVIAMAGQNDVVDEAALTDAGVRGVLRKPLDSMQLVDAVRAALREGRRPAEAAPWRPAVFEGPEHDADVVMGPTEAPASVESEAAVGSADAAGPGVFDTTAAGEPPSDAAGGARGLTDADLERVAARVAAIWAEQSASPTQVAALLAEQVDRVAPSAATAAAERLVRELAPAVVAEVARHVVADVSERLVREEIARMRAAHAAR